MKKSILILLGISPVLLLLGVSLGVPGMAAAQQDKAAAAQPADQQQEQQTPPPSAEEVRKVVSYFLGFRTGQQLSQLGPIQLSDLDKDIFYNAIADGVKEQPSPEYVEKDLRSIMEAFSKVMNERNAELAKKNKEISKKVAEENGKKEGVVTLPSGVQYRELAKADGEKYDQKKHGTNASVKITYQLRLSDGTVVQETAEPVDMPLTGMLPSIAEAVKLLPVGAEWELFIPSEQGYGEQGPGPLSAAAPFFFKVKLHEIKPAGTPEHPIELTPEMLQQLQEAGLQPVEGNNDAPTKK